MSLFALLCYLEEYEGEKREISKIGANKTRKLERKSDIEKEKNKRCGDFFWLLALQERLY